ncbi:MAG: DUF4422 domain-containing protein [Clostridium sp.]
MYLSNGKSSNIYVIYHFPYNVINSDIFTQIIPSKAICPQLSYMISADTLDEISNKNNFLAEYSTYYWVWKNTTPTDYIGFFQYRRYLNLNSVNNTPWSSEALTQLTNDYDIILPNKIQFNCSILDQYAMFHDPFYINKAIEILSTKHPTITPYFKEALTFNEGSFCNMFYMKWYFFNEYMSIMIPLFNELELFLNPGHQPKIFAYIGERLFNGYIHFLKSTKNPSIKHLDIVMM